NTVDSESEGDNSTLPRPPIASYIIGILTNPIDPNEIDSDTVLSKRIGGDRIQLVEIEIKKYDAIKRLDYSLRATVVAEVAIEEAKEAEAKDENNIIYSFYGFGLYLVKRYIYLSNYSGNRVITLGYSEVILYQLNSNNYDLNNIRYNTNEIIDDPYRILYNPNNFDLKNIIESKDNNTSLINKNNLVTKSNIEPNSLTVIPIFLRVFYNLYLLDRKEKILLFPYYNIQNELISVFPPNITAIYYNDTLPSNIRSTIETSVDKL
ncbi:hypothetical protein N7527_000143, partial [Penicillium freii]